MCLIALALSLEQSRPTSLAQQPEWDPVSIAPAHLASTSASAGFAAATSNDQELLEVRDSPGAVHARMQQTLNGIPFAGAGSTPSMREGDQQVDFAVDRRVHHAPAANASPTLFSASDAISTATVGLGLTGTVRGPAQLVYLSRGLDGDAGDDGREVRSVSMLS